MTHPQVEVHVLTLFVGRRTLLVMPRRTERRGPNGALTSHFLLRLLLSLTAVSIALNPDIVQYVYSPLARTAPCVAHHMPPLSIQSTSLHMVCET